jgi:uncharacterized delta-60 repeat protein
MVALAHFTANGQLDTTFGAGGVLTTAIGSNDAANAVAVQPDGRIVIAGLTTLADKDYLVARYNPNGTLDGTFGAGSGYTTIDFGDGAQSSSALRGATGLALQADGRIVIEGTTTDGVSNGPPLIGVARLNSDGTLDGTFGAAGVITTEVPGGWVDGNDLALQADGKIVVFGQAVVAGESYMAVVRYNPDGTLDSGTSMTATPPSGSGWVKPSDQSGSTLILGSLAPDGRGFGDTFRLLTKRHGAL